MRNNTHDAVLRLRLTNELLEQLRKKSQHENYSVSEAAREAIRRFVK